MRSDTETDAVDRETARTLAKTGAQLGAATGGRVGPVTTGLASGLGGAVGYLAGAAVDGARTTLDGRAVTDGGRPPDDAQPVEIPVEQSDRSEGE